MKLVQHPITLVLMAFLLAWAPAAQAAEPPPNPALEVSTLANGMTLVVKVDRRAATAVHMVWVRVGSVDEVDGTSGVAHVLEHLMFKGTPTVPEGAFSKQVAAMGGTDNAFTSRDMTAYHQQVPVGRLLDVMRLEADRFANVRWSDDAFAREMRVIQEERRQRVEESPQARLFEAFAATAHLAHPYRRPIIGWMSDLEAMVSEDAKAFHRRWYVPANAAVVVVGDVDPPTVRAWAEQTYGAIPAGVVPARKPQVDPPQKGMRRMEYKAGVRQPMVVMGYRAPSLAALAPTGAPLDAGSEDALALTLLAGVLDGHSAARLERSLVQGQGGRRLADSVGASYGLMGRGPQLFWLTGTPASGVSPAELEQGLKAELRRVAESGVTEAELQRVKNQWLASEVYKLDSVFGQARELGTYWVQGWHPGSGPVLMDRLARVTPEQVQAVARRYADDTQLTVGWLLPEVAP